MGDGQGIKQAGPVTDLTELGVNLLPVAAHKIPPLAPHGNNTDRHLLLQNKAGRFPIYIGIKSPAQTAVRGDMHNGYFIYFPALQQGVQYPLFLGQSGQVTDYLPYLLGIGAPRQTTLLGSPHLQGGNHLHRPGNLGGALDAANTAAN